MWPFNSPCHETIRNHRTCVHVCTPAKGELQCLGDGHQFKYLNLSLEIVQVFYYMHTCRFLFCCFWPSLQNFQNKKFFQPKYEFFSLSNKTRNCVLFCVWNLLSLTRKWRVKPLNPRTFTIWNHEHVVGLASKWASDFSLVLKYFYPLSWQDFQTQTMYKLYIQSHTHIDSLPLYDFRSYSNYLLLSLVCVCCSCVLCWLITFNR